MTTRIPAGTVNEIRRLGRLGITPTTVSRITGTSVSAVKRYVKSDPGGGPVVENQDWRDEARCATETWAFWGPLSSDDEAKTVCRSCPVSAECLRFALVHKIGTDVWGGYTADERDDMVRGRTS